MLSSGTGTDRLRSYLVMAATAGTIAFNFIAATGRLGGGVDTGAISDKYPTVVTPAGYAFSIWTLIYVGLVAFSIYQLLPQNLVKFRNVRLLYIISCVLNCTWLYFWQGEQIVVCAVI
ncbi:MAG: tryptophan-rich sensory protein, partial [Acidobacteria bacterium]|nr:tryptophan-rich sensory protein [Acidobacteriota bacterium]